MGGEGGTTPWLVPLGDFNNDGVPDLLSYQPGAPVLFVDFMTAEGVPARSLPLDVQGIVGEALKSHVTGPNHNQAWPLDGPTWSS